MIRAQLLLTIYLLTSGWGPPLTPGIITGRAWSPPECYTCWHTGEFSCEPLPQPVCFGSRYWLHVGPDGFPVSRETWQRYGLGGDYP